MKHQHYIVPALMLLTGGAWGDGYRSYHGHSPYGVHGNPTALQFYGHQGYYPEPSNPYVSRAIAPSYGRYGTQYGPDNPYTPYSSPNPYKINGNPYATDAIDIPYNDSPYRAGTPYSTYGSHYHPHPAVNPYFPNPIINPYGASTNYLSNPYGGHGSPYHQSPATYPYAADAQQHYPSHGYYQGSLSAPNSVPLLYEPYNNPYFPDAFNVPFGNGYKYDLGNNQSSPFEQ